jgi:predicted GNAT superfamily acetyltransferase
MSSTSQKTSIVIRDIERVSEMSKLVELEKEVWGVDDRDLTPLSMLIATKEVGAIITGAFDGETLVGFVYGFVGYENAGEPLVIHSHMLAVRPACRNFNLGYKLKLAQRERAMAKGIRRITWTFDPLQSLNAHFNFGKLGVVSDAYKVNFYGAQTSSFLHRLGTDRLWANWLIDSRRVERRLHGDSKWMELPDNLERVAPLAQFGADGAPLRNESAKCLDQPYAMIEIPTDINALQQENPELAVEWREATRWAFTEAIASGYTVTEFYQTSRRDQRLGVYLLNSKSS